MKTPLWFRSLRLWWRYYTCKHPRRTEIFRDYHDRYILYKCPTCGKQFFVDL
ncbi:hypothetical protein [Spirosoma fluminis]